MVWFPMINIYRKKDLGPISRGVSNRTFKVEVLNFLSQKVQLGPGASLSIYSAKHGARQFHTE